MSQGLDRTLHKALRTLVCRNSTLHQRLYEASKGLSAVLERPELWPQELLPEAESVQRRLTAKGKIVDAVCGMDTSDAAEVAEDIMNLAIQIDVAKRRRLDTHGHRTLPRGGARLPLEMPQEATIGR